MTNDYFMKRSERLSFLAAERSGKGGVAVACALAMFAWALALVAHEQWWCIPLGMLAGMVLLWGLRALDDGRKYYRLAEEERRYDALKRRSAVEEML
jgi:steroid 5-alpha reductase family enzyme